MSQSTFADIAEKVLTNASQIAVSCASVAIRWAMTNGSAMAQTPQFKSVVGASAIVGALAFASGYVQKDVTRLERFTMPLQKLQVSPPPNYLSKRAAKEVSTLALPETRFHAFNGRLIPTIEHALTCLPWVDKVNSIQLKFPNKVRFSCSVLEPAALVSWKGNRIVVADNGRQFPKSYLEGYDLNGSPELPLITGLDAKATSTETLLSALKLISRLKKEKVLSSAQISQVDVSNIGGRLDSKKSEVVLKTSTGITIDWGRLPDSGQLQVSFEDRASRLKSVLKSMGVDELKSISLRWDKTVYTQRVKPDLSNIASR